MSGEIIQSVVYDNYNDFQHVNFIFSQIFIFVIFTKMRAYNNLGMLELDLDLI